ncbi:sugar transport protein 6-like [Malania oleifera]|uniref:sugar transport protein 6-like n=1 Tax=Malania oleifera TaxID=397392 RepID=UPI0025AE67CF|nr:sugar transport protein 6-like [Malania oleifera]
MVLLSPPPRCHLLQPSSSPLQNMERFIQRSRAVHDQRSGTHRRSYSLPVTRDELRSVITTYRDEIEYGPELGLDSPSTHSPNIEIVVVEDSSQPHALHEEQIEPQHDSPSAHALDTEIVVVGDSSQPNALHGELSTHDARGSNGRHCRVEVLWGLVFFISGLLLGYSLTVPVGLLSMDKFMHIFFPRIFYTLIHAKEDNFCSYGNQILSFSISSLYLAAIVMMPAAPMVHQRLGRRWAIFSATLVVAIGDSITLILPHTSALFGGKILMGLGIGLLYQLIPINLSEIELDEVKKMLELISQFSMISGGLLACVVNYYTSLYPDWGWMVSLAVIEPLCVLLLNLFGLIPVASPIFREQINQGGRFKEALRHLSWQKIIQYLAAQVLPRAIGVDTLGNYMPIMLEGIGISSQTSYRAAIVISSITLGCSFMTTMLLKKYRVQRRFLFSFTLLLVVLLQVAIMIVLISKLNKYQVPDLNTSGLLSAFMLLLTSGVAIITAPEGCLVISFSEETNTVASILSNVTYFFFSVLVSHLFFLMLCSWRALVFLFFAFLTTIVGFIFWYFQDWPM